MAGEDEVEVEFSITPVVRDGRQRPCSPRANSTCSKRQALEASVAAAERPWSRERE
jgi:hypothetical protein